MGAQKAHGVILRKYLLRETSYILVVYTREFGKIKGVLKGARNPAPQFAGNFEIFSLCQLLFYRRKKTSLDLITQCEALEFYLPARKQIERLTYANYFIELIDIICNENDPNRAIFGALVKSLRLLSSGASPKRTARIFELKLLEALGLSPGVQECVGCGRKSETGMSFSVSSGGTLCSGCAVKDPKSFPISAGTVNFIRRIQSSSFERTGHIKVSREVGVEIEKLLKAFLEFHVNRQSRSMDFVKHLEKAGMA
ncbi:MAG: DNA repair protein RecO [Candidatus Omnitrophica bacterium]|nr:DNA repair protein RecO [Candidatus Omnitrophota bacterium]